MSSDVTFYTFCHWNSTGQLVPFPQNKGCLHPVGKWWVIAFFRLVIPCNLSFIMGPLSLFSRVIISTLRIPSKTGLVLLRKDWKKWKKVTCLLRSYTWRLQFCRSPTMQRYSLLCLVLAKEKGTPVSMEWWNEFWAQAFASHDWLKHWILRVMN